jgi:uncharacterized protein YecT (DUF1311 family)
MQSLRTRVKRTVLASALVIVGGALPMVPAAEALGQPHATADASGGLKPPLVTEPPGGPGPCSQQNQIDVDNCAVDKLLAVDKVLNADIKVIWGLLGASGRSEFVKVQMAWTAYRNADCTLQSDVYEGGTAQPMEYLFCLAADDSSRRQDLRGYFELMTQGTHPAPKFP